MAFSHFLATFARRLPADVRRCQSSLRSITQLTRLHTISPLTATRHPSTPKFLSPTLLFRDSITSQSSGVYSGFHQYQTHPVNPPNTLPKSPIENPRAGFSTNVLKLTCDSADGGTCVVHLVGTCHVSPESCIEVKAVIRKIKPQVVFLELCESRKYVLTQLDREVSDKLDILPGSELRVGYEEARKLGSKVVLGDRPANVTIRRIWRKTPLWHKTKLICSLFFTPFALRRVDQVIQELVYQFPAVHETILNERDQYMSSTLLRVARCHHSVVAVVGESHLTGIKKYWLQPVDIDKLMEIR